MLQLSMPEDEAINCSARGCGGGDASPAVMGDAFRRVGSRVWWSEEAEDAVAAAGARDAADDAPESERAAAGAGAGAGAAGAGTAACPSPAAVASTSAERCSPSSSHRSADSGFSDRSASPGGCAGNPFLGRLDLSCFERSPSEAKEKRQQQHKQKQQQQRKARGADASPAAALARDSEARKQQEEEGEEREEEEDEGRGRCETPCASPAASPPPASPDCDALDFTGLEGPAGPPAHTSTPKAAAAAALSPAPGHAPSRARRHGAGALNLLGAFNSGGGAGVAGAATAAGAPVRRWLSELAAATDPECTTALQSKSLAADLGRQVAAAAAAATSSVRVLQERTRRIAAEFNKLCRQLELGTMEHLGPLVQSLTGHVAEFARQQGAAAGPRPVAQGAGAGAGAGEGPGEALERACDALRQAAAARPPQRDRLSSDAAALGAAFTAVVDAALLTHISVLVAVLEAPASEMALRAALAALAALGLEGRHLSSLVAEAGGVRALLGVVLESRCSSVRAAAMRALAAVACAPDAIRCLEQAGGVEVLAELLADDARPEPELAEAAAVLAQATAPWVEDNPGVRGLADHLATLVRSLSELAERTKSAETLLLAAAALANVTYMEPRAVWELLAAGTAGRLLRAVRRLGAEASVFLQEQAAALLAAMAAVPESRERLAEERAVVALLCFLQVRASPLQEQPEIAAAERLQHKSAIALSRLCSDPAVAEQVVVLQGVTRLVRLCRDERERNHSDGVLVACLAALRKIAANCGTQVMEDLDALELVEPRLLDSFLLYSSRQESYV